MNHISNQDIHGKSRDLWSNIEEHLTGSFAVPYFSSRTDKNDFTAS